jgi:phosphoglycolate phosphatase-like HAD superfamily hydrolase
LLIFDFDGVLIDSNQLKQRVFIFIAEKYIKSPHSLRDFQQYLTENSAESRDLKLSYLKSLNINLCLEDLLSEFANKLDHEYKNCVNILEILNDLDDWVICSAGHRQEIEAILDHKKVNYKVANIYSDLNDKSSVLKNFSHPTNCFLGDSYSDFSAAEVAGIDFYFCSYWALISEIEKMKYVHSKRINDVESLKKLVQKSL